MSRIILEEIPGNISIWCFEVPPDFILSYVSLRTRESLVGEGTCPNDNVTVEHRVILGELE